jgi:hypothetical protein
VKLEQSLASVGVASHAATVLASAARRPRGMVVFCGPAGVGKTTLAQLIVAAQCRTLVHWLGDLRMSEEIRAALTLAECEPVVAVVRSGQSTGLRDRWADMALSLELVDRASLVTVTLRRLARIPESRAASPDVFVVEVLAPDGRLGGSGRGVQCRGVGLVRAVLRGELVIASFAVAVAAAGRRTRETSSAPQYTA